MMRAWIQQRIETLWGWVRQHPFLISMAVAVAMTLVWVIVVAFGGDEPSPAATAVAEPTDWWFWGPVVLFLGTVLASAFKLGGRIIALFAGAFLMTLFGVFAGKTVLGDRAAEGQELLAERALEFLARDPVEEGAPAGMEPSVNGFTAEMLRPYTARIPEGGEYVLTRDRAYICYTFKEGGDKVTEEEEEGGVKFVNTTSTEVRVSGNRHPLLGHVTCGDAFSALQQAGVL